MVYWINRAVALFDQLIANGHSALVFLEFTTLSLPNVVRLVLPMAGFAAVIWTTNRLQSDSELVVIQATGYPPKRLARPVLVFGFILTALLLILAHVLVPASRAELNERQAEISRDLTARFLREGVFIHPATGVTFFVGRIAETGQLENIFLADNRTAGEETIYTARRALFLREGEDAQLVMLDGMAQVKTEGATDIAVTTFSDFVFDVKGFVNIAPKEFLNPKELTTIQLLRQGAPGVPKTRVSDRARWVEIHERTAQAFLAPGAAVIGFATLLIGGFSRFGLWRQIVLAVLILVAVKALDNSLIAAGRQKDGIAALVYVGPGIALIVSAGLLWLAARPSLFSVRRWRKGGAQ